MKRKLTIAERIEVYFLNRACKKLYRKLNTCKYNIYLNTEHWKFFSTEKRKSEAFRCQSCGGVGYEVHHKTYKHRGYETFSDVLCLCHTCHMKIHKGTPAHLDSRYK